MGTIYTLFQDRDKTQPVQQFTTRNDELFKEQNQKGYGVYFSVNEFSEKRKKENLTKLRYAYCDIDIAKHGDNKTQAEKQESKDSMKKMLIDYCEPTFIIDTANGLQPLWKITDTDPANTEAYIQVLKGIRLWTKDRGSAGDNVYDVSRVVRLPGYYHQKGAPYLCDFVHKSKKIYSLVELAKLFPFSEEKKNEATESTVGNNPVFAEIDRLDFRELIKRAFSSVGRPVEFDESGHMIDPVGGTTGTFIGRNGNRDYLASSSHEPFKGNRVTAVAQILNVDYSDAYKWICSEYSLDFKRLEQKQQEDKVKVLKKELGEDKRYTWGTRRLNESFAVIQPGNLIVIAAESGAGKTTFTFHMACENALMGNKALYLSLEMDEKKLYDSFGRAYAGITAGDVYFNRVTEIQKNAFERRIKEIKALKNLKFIGIRRATDPTWENIREMISNEHDSEIIFIDNLDLIAGQRGETDVDRQTRIISQLMSFTAETNMVIVLVHHYRKKSANGKDQGIDEMRGSGKIKDGADRVVRLTRNRDKDAKPSEKCRTNVVLQKGRDYADAAEVVYFVKGKFVDEAPPEKEEDLKNDDNEIINNLLNT